MGKANVASGAPTVTILFISLSAAQYNLESDWAEAGADFIVRHCPICVQDSIVGHGRRRKQAHDEHHDWIGIRRGLCNRCGKTFTFLPPFSPPYGHHSFIARSQALQRYFLEGRCWEDAAPTVKDPDRVADPSTLRRWFRNLDSSRPRFSALHRTMLALSAWLAIQGSIAGKDRDAFAAVRAVRVASDIVGDVKTPLLVIFTAVFFVLLIACLNVANLILARSSARQREFAIRLALGAGRARLIRQLSTESLLLGILGGVVGISVAAVMTKALVAMAPANVPRLAGVRMDSQALLFTLAISMLTGLLCGLVPAFTFAARRFGDQLKAGGRGTGQSTGGRLRSVLVVTEIALAIVPVAGAGLMVQSLYRLEQVQPGFRTENILSFFVSIPQVKYSAARQTVFFGELMDRIRSIPGVESVGATTALPLSGTDEDYSFEIEGRSRLDGQPLMGAHYRVVTPDYFMTLGIPLLRGRVFSERDTSDSVPAVVINEALARRYFPSDDPLGKHIRIGNGRRPIAVASEVIGIVKDVNHSSLSARPAPEMYECYSQAPQLGMTLTVRSGGDPRILVPAIRRELGALDRDVPLSKVLTIADLMDESLALSRFRASLLRTLRSR